jgi:hypothetical protein
VFGWLLTDRRVANVARVIHEMCCYAHRLRESGGPLHGCLTHHPMLKNHRAPPPENSDLVHIFWLSDGRQGFEVMISDGQQKKPAWLAIAPDGDFDGVRVQSGSRARYTVLIDHSRSQGRLATKLARKFVAAYGAVDTGE